MRAIFVSGTGSIGKMNSSFRIIRRILLSAGHELTLDWLDFIEKNSKEITSSKFYEKTKSAIFSSEMIFIEATHINIEVAQYIEVARRAKKPTLVLVSKDAKITKEERESIVREDELYIKVEEYFAQEIEKIINRFIDEQKDVPVSRFNLMIERQQRDYLDWASIYYKRARTDIIKELINYQIKNDQNYQRQKGNVTQIL